MGRSHGDCLGGFVVEALLKQTAGLVKKQIDFSKYPNIVKWWDEIRKWPAIKKMYDSCVDGRKMIP